MTAAHQIDASIGSGAWRGLDPRADRVYQSVLSAEARRLVREMRIGAPPRHTTLASDVCQEAQRGIDRSPGHECLDSYPPWGACASRAYCALGGKLRSDRCSRWLGRIPWVGAGFGAWSGGLIGSDSDSRVSIGERLCCSPARPLRRASGVDRQRRLASGQSRPDFRLLCQRIKPGRGAAENQ